MGCLGNIIWFLACGLWEGFSWVIAGLLWSITIIGIPIGKQCFKLASLTFFPSDIYKIILYAEIDWFIMEERVIFR